MIWINRPAAGRSECHDAVRLQGGTPLYSARDCPSGRDLETVGMLIGLDVAGHALQSRLLRDTWQWHGRKIDVIVVYKVDRLTRSLPRRARV